VRIAFVTEKFLRVDGSLYQGGAELHLARLMGVLAERGHDVTILQAGDEAGSTDYQGARVTSVKVRGTHPLVRRADLLRKWPKAINRSTDRVHLNQYFLARPVRRSYRLTATSHGVDFDIPSDLPLAASRRASRRLLAPATEIAALRTILRTQARVALQSTDAIASVDTAFLRFVRTSLPRGRAKVTYIPNFVDDEFFGEMSTTKARPAIVLFPRNPSPSRGPHIALGALKLIQERGVRVELRVVGGGSLLEDMRAAAVDLGVLDIVSFVGQIDHSAMAAELAGALIAIFPSVCAEGTSLACLEAMASGTAVIVSNVGGLTDLVIDGFNGRVVEPTVRHLAESIEQAIRQSDETATMALNGRAVANAFRFTRWRQQWLNFFAE
jgi:glycosyltransferase involved in cell wall biosynthesis